MFIHSLGTPIINDWNLQSTMFNKKLMNITIQNVQSANGITINPTQNKRVFIHSVPDGILRAWWMNPVPDRCVPCDMTTNPSVLMSRLLTMAPTETTKNKGDLKMIPSNTSVY